MVAGQLKIRTHPSTPLGKPQRDSEQSAFSMKTTRRCFLTHTASGLMASGGLLYPMASRSHAATAPYTHDTSVLVAALHAPEPFRSHWRSCRGGSWPDYMRDQPVGHANQRLAGLLYTLDAMRHLQSGHINKALLLASARCHYVGDSACIAHAAVWKPRAKDDLLQRDEPGKRVWSFMPADVQDYWLPFQESSSLNYDPILISPPPLFQQKWQKLTKTGRPGNMHAFFDQTHALLGFPGRFPDNVHDFGKYIINEVGIPDTKNWSTYDREFYGRWLAEKIALTVIDRKSVLARSQPIRFTGDIEFQAALEAEMANMVASISTYYRYLTTAANAQVVGDVEELFPSVDRLALLARARPKIYLSADAPWPLKRACHLLAMEIVRGQHRNKGRWGGQYGERILEESSAIFDTVTMPAATASTRVLIAWKTSPEKVVEHAAARAADLSIQLERDEGDAAHITLQGSNLQSTIHLVDFLLDIMNAPLHGKVPIDVVSTVLRREWEGIRLMKELDKLTDEQAASQPERPQNPHEHEQEAWSARVRRMLNPNTYGQSDISGPLVVYSNLMLKQLPLPDGRTLGIGVN